MGRIVQPVVLTVPIKHQRRCHQPSFDDILTNALLRQRRNMIPPRECQRFECQPRLMPRFACTANKPWIQEIDMNGYQPGDIKIKIDNGLLVVHARKEVVQCDNVDVKERKRVVKIPDGVSKNNITCRMNRLGHFVVIGTFESKKNEAVDSDSKAAEKSVSEQKSDGCTEQKRQHGDDATKVGEDKNDTESNHDDALPRDEEVNVASKCNTEENDVKSATSLADLLHERLATSGEEKQESDIPISRSPVPFEDFEVIDENNDSLTNVGTDDTKREDQPATNMDSSEIAVKDGKTSFTVKLDLQDYPADSISVQCKDNTLVVDAEHKIAEGDMVSSQRVHREYQLPASAVKTEARASVDGDGIFTITVPISNAESEEKRTIPIVHE